MEFDNRDCAFTNWFSLHGQNRPSMHLFLARLTDFIERESGLPSRYTEYIVASGKHAYEIEHIWANKLEYHLDEFSHNHDFQGHRNRIGGLLLLPKQFNASYGAMPYDQKLPHYYGQNLLAKSLSPQCYQNQPGFLGMVSRTGLPFCAHTIFKRANLEERSRLYVQIAERIWNPDQLDRMLAEAGV
jgi:hypothetical protein